MIDPELLAAASWTTEPVVVREGWEADWTALLQQLSDVLSPATRAQSAAEVIMLTHDETLHEVDLGWHPQAEQALWRPDLQEAETSQNGQLDVRYRADVERAAAARLRALIGQHAPWSTVRYAV